MNSAQCLRQKFHFHIPRKLVKAEISFGMSATPPTESFRFQSQIYLSTNRPSDTNVYSGVYYWRDFYYLLDASLLHFLTDVVKVHSRSKKQWNSNHSTQRIQVHYRMAYIEVYLYLALSCLNLDFSLSSTRLLIKKSYGLASHLSTSVDITRK